VRRLTCDSTTKYVRCACARASVKIFSKFTVFPLIETLQDRLRDFVHEHRVVLATRQLFDPCVSDGVFVGDYEAYGQVPDPQELFCGFAVWTTHESVECVWRYLQDSLLGAI